MQVGDQRVTGQTKIERWTWHQVGLVRSPGGITVMLAGQATPEIEFPLAAPSPEQQPIAHWTFGGRSDNEMNWEGKLDEIALYGHAMNATELAQLLSN